MDDKDRKPFQVSFNEFLKGDSVARAEVLDKAGLEEKFADEDGAGVYCGRIRAKWKS